MGSGKKLNKTLKKLEKIYGPRAINFFSKEKLKGNP